MSKREKYQEQSIAEIKEKLENDINEFFKNGGKVTELQEGETGVEANMKKSTQKSRAFNK